ncbi:hypothetical protein KEM48_008997 [Puccinia striiformis f. sp. tritici PST-130]|nr:hypothetical protein KEM48_008997 [Puccinia striiformis f. sp. tritici PST-130]
MFKRAHSTKPGTRITGSARKKLISSINQEIAAQALPPSISISRAYTHLKEQISIYYDDQPNPIYFQAESRLVPTIYTLLEHPRLLPILETNSVVLDKLTNGADLMRPGLLRTDLQKITHLKKNDSSLSLPPTRDMGRRFSGCGCLGFIGFRDWKSCYNSAY